MIIYLARIGLSLLLSALIGSEREYNEKPAGLRTIMSICLGATLIAIFTLKFIKTIGLNFDAIRGIAYYLVAIGFVGGGIINKGEGITTASILLPVTILGFFCGLGYYILATVSGLCIYGILIMPYIMIKLKKLFKRNDKN